MRRNISLVSRSKHLVGGTRSDTLVAHLLWKKRQRERGWCSQPFNNKINRYAAEGLQKRFSWHVGLAQWYTKAGNWNKNSPCGSLRHKYENRSTPISTVECFTLHSFSHLSVINYLFVYYDCLYICGTEPLIPQRSSLLPLPSHQEYRPLNINKKNLMIIESHSHQCRFNRPPCIRHIANDTHQVEHTKQERHSNTLQEDTKCPCILHFISLNLWNLLGISANIYRKIALFFESK